MSKRAKWILAISLAVVLVGAIAVVWATVNERERKKYEQKTRANNEVLTYDFTDGSRDVFCDGHLLAKVTAHYPVYKALYATEEAEELNGTNPWDNTTNRYHLLNDQEESIVGKYKDGADDILNCLRHNTYMKIEITYSARAICGYFLTFQVNTIETKVDENGTEIISIDTYLKTIDLKGKQYIDAQGALIVPGHIVSTSRMLTNEGKDYVEDILTKQWMKDNPNDGSYINAVGTDLYDLLIPPFSLLIRENFFFDEHNLIICAYSKGKEMTVPIPWTRSDLIEADFSKSMRNRIRSDAQAITDSTGSSATVSDESVNSRSVSGAEDVARKFIEAAYAGNVKEMQKYYAFDLNSWYRSMSDILESVYNGNSIQDYVDEYVTGRRQPSSLEGPYQPFSSYYDEMPALYGSWINPSTIKEYVRFQMENGGDIILGKIGGKWLVLPNGLTPDMFSFLY